MSRSLAPGNILSLDERCHKFAGIAMLSHSVFYIFPQSIKVHGSPSLTTHVITINTQQMPNMPPSSARAVQIPSCRSPHEV